jgi:hypothetical protein
VKSSDKFSIEVFLARTRVDHEQILVFRQAMDNNIIHKRSLRIEQRRILRLSDREARRIIHRDMLHGGQGFRTGQTDIAHVADVKNADASAHRHVLGDNAAPDRRRVFDRHIPAVKLHHLRAHLAMDGV